MWYRLTMKTNSDNFRESAIFDIINKLKNSGIKVIIYEPIINKKEINDCIIINDFNKFQDSVDLIIANRFDDLLKSSKKEVYTRDLYNRD